MLRIVSLVLWIGVIVAAEPWYGRYDWVQLERGQAVAAAEREDLERQQAAFRRRVTVLQDRLQRAEGQARQTMESDLVHLQAELQRIAYRLGGEREIERWQIHIAPDSVSMDTSQGLIQAAMEGDTGTVLRGGERRSVALATPPEAITGIEDGRRFGWPVRRSAFQAEGRHWEVWWYAGGRNPYRVAYTGADDETLLHQVARLPGMPLELRTVDEGDDIIWRATNLSPAGKDHQ